MNRSLFTLIPASASLLLGAGCENAGQGALSGAGIGALSGLAIGSLSGDAGKGAAIGAIAGAVGGAVIGDQNRRQNEANAAARSAPPPPAPPASPQPYQTGEALSAFLGEWTIKGRELTNGQWTDFEGTATGVKEKNYFVRLEIRVNNPSTGQTVLGSSILAQQGGTKIEMTNAFSSSPQMKRFRGDMDKTGKAFYLRQVDVPQGEQARRMLIRVETDGRLTVDVWNADSGSKSKTETYTFLPKN